MELKLVRDLFAKKRTFGKMFDEAGEFLWFTLECTDRFLTSAMSLEETKKIKFYGQTCIGYGRYKVELAWSSHFQRMMPHLLNVVGFGGILMHGGTTEADTLGCILIAHNENVEQGTIQGKATDDMIAILEGAKKSNQDVYLTITK